MTRERLCVRFGRYSVHSTEGLTRGRQRIHLTPKSLAVLYALASRAGQVVTKEDLLRCVWPDTAVSDAALSSCILELRRALGDEARRPRYIETLHRRGFRFVARCMVDGCEVPDAGASLLTPGPVDPFVGREQAIERVETALARAHRGERQVVFVAGGAGIGKTALVDACTARLGQPWRTVRGECVEQYSVSEAWGPLLDVVTRLSRSPEGEVFVSILRRYAPAWLSHLPALVGPCEWRLLQRRTAGVTPVRMLRELTDALETMAAHTPLLICLDDLHWSDPATLNWVASFARRREPARILLMAAYRNEEVHRARMLDGLIDDLRIRSLCTTIALDPLGESAVTEYVERRFPAAPGEDSQLRRLAGLVYRHTNGHPLFLVHVLNDLIERHVLVPHDGLWALGHECDAQTLGVPRDLRRAIERQLDRVSGLERQLIEGAAVARGPFASATIAAAAQVSSDEAETLLGALARRGAFIRQAAPVRWPDGTASTTFEFLHALCAIVIAEGLSPARRTALHLRIARRLEEAFGGRAVEIAPQLAVHFEAGGDIGRTVVYLQHTAESSRLRGAHGGAQCDFRRALALLEQLPASIGRDAREAVLRVALGRELAAEHGIGAADVEASYARAYTLSGQLEPTPDALTVLWGLWVYYLNRGPLGTARILAARLLDWATTAGDSSWQLHAHHAMWSTALQLGDLPAVQAHVVHGLVLASATGVPVMTYGCTMHDVHAKDHDAAVCAGFLGPWADALAGRMETAAKTLDRAVARARGLDHPFTLALTLVFAAGVHLASRDAPAARARAAEGAALALDHGFTLVLAFARLYEGRALADLGQAGPGFVLQNDGDTTCRAIGSIVFRCLHLAMLAETQLRHGRPDDARQTLDEATRVADRTGARLSAPEHHRIRGELFAASCGSAALDRAEEELRAAIAVAQEQGAHLFALRAAVALARLRARSRRRGEVMALLAATRAAVTEGAHLPDVAEATGLLERAGQA